MSQWLKFYSIVLLYIGFCPLLFITMAVDISNECCYGRYTRMGLFALIGYALVCSVCNGLEALRKNFASVSESDAGEEGRRDLEMDGNAKEVPEEERLSLI